MQPMHSLLSMYCNPVQLQHIQTAQNALTTIQILTFYSITTLQTYYYDPETKNENGIFKNKFIP